jgi:hypothetical protein
VKIKILAAATSALALFSLTLTSPIGAVQPNANKDTYKLVLLQAQPTIKTLDAGSLIPGATETIFGAKLTTTKGKASGYLTGSILTEEIIKLAPAGQYRLRNLTFTLPKGQIVAKGNSFYPDDQSQLAFNENAVIAVIGGTGEYLGASGEVRTTRKANGTYRHVFTLLK